MADPFPEVLSWWHQNSACSESLTPFLYVFGQWHDRKWLCTCLVIRPRTSTKHRSAPQPLRRRVGRVPHGYKVVCPDREPKIDQPNFENRPQLLFCDMTLLITSRTSMAGRWRRPCNMSTTRVVAICFPDVPGLVNRGCSANEPRISSALRLRHYHS